MTNTPAPLTEGTEITIELPGYPGVWTIVQTAAERAAADPAERGTVQVRRVIDNDGDPAVWVTVVREIDVRVADQPAAVEPLAPAERPTGGPARGEALAVDGLGTWIVTHSEADLIAERGERERGFFRAAHVFTGAGRIDMASTFRVGEGYTAPEIDPAAADGARGMLLTTAGGPLVVLRSTVATVEPVLTLKAVREVQAAANLPADVVEVERKAGAWVPVATRLAYTAANVVYAVGRTEISALWTPDPELAALGGAALFDRLCDRSVEIELIGQARKHTKAAGALYSGWIIEMDGNHLDPIARKTNAHLMLRDLVEEYLTEREPAAAPTGPAVDDAISIDGRAGVWVVTHTPDSPAVHVRPAAYALDPRRPLTHTYEPFGYYRARRVYVGGAEDVPAVFRAASVRPAALAAAGAPVGQLGIWFTAGNGPIVAPIDAAWIGDASVYADRVRNWQRRVGRELDAVVVARTGAGWADGNGMSFRAPAAPSQVGAPSATPLPAADAVEWAVYFADDGGEHVRRIEGPLAECAVELIREVQAGIRGGRPNAALLCRVAGAPWDLAPRRTPTTRPVDAA